MVQPHEKLTVQYATQTPYVAHWQTTVQMEPLYKWNQCTNGHKDLSHLGCEM